jgi:hypothetical protein
LIGNNLIHFGLSVYMIHPYKQLQLSRLLPIGLLVSVLLQSACYEYGGAVTSAENADNVRALATQIPSEKRLIGVNVLGVSAVKGAYDAVIDDAAVRQLNDQLLRSFESELNLEVKSLLETNLQLGDPTAIRQTLSQVSLQGVDAVLVTLIDKYQERKGSRVGAEQAAEVAFRMQLLDVKTGSELWQAQYHFRDHALSDNLFDIRAKGESGAGPGWKKADQLVAGAFRAAARDVAERRDRLFLNTSYSR